MDLDGRVAFVTGASGSLGSTIALALAAAGCDIAVGYLGHGPGADDTARAVERLGRRTCRVQLDQTDPAAAGPAVTRATRELGRLDILVNNAGWNIGIPFTDLDALTTDIWERIFHTNVRGPFQLARAAAVPMRAQGGDAS
jgi:3-oxoacyl-[acyl-carrier protein] reductase